MYRALKSWFGDDPNRTVETDVEFEEPQPAGKYRIDHVCPDCGSETAVWSGDPQGFFGVNCQRCGAMMDRD